MNTKAALHSLSAKGGGAGAFSLFESISLLNECRDVAADWLSESLDKMLAQLDEALIEQADKSYGKEANTLMESRALVQARRKEIEQHFRRRFVESFNKKINASPQETSFFGKVPTGGLELSLVANDDFEEQLTIDDIAKRIKMVSVSELNALDQRLGLLMQREVDDRDNPLGPAAITDAFKVACEDLDISSDIKRVMLDQFNTRFVNNVPVFYQTINEHLVTRNVMPVISAMPRRQTATPATQRGEVAAAQQNDAVGGMHDLAQAMEQGDWQQVLSHLMGRGGMSGGPVAGVSQSAGTPAQAGMTAAGLFSELSRLQHHQGGPDLGANILRELKAGSLSQVAAGTESITIDIVAMLFDYIFDDKSIPASIKALIGRLQIPVLKVAILDNKFFSRKTHPARRLLDTLASASIGLVDEDANCQRLQAKVSEIVHQILSEFEDDLDIFTQAQLTLDTFLAEEEKHSAEAAAKTAKSIYDRERLELARVMAADELRQRAAQPHVPDAMREFFRKTWSEVAARCFVQGGEQGQLWADALRTVDDLIWSVAPKISVEERMKLVTLLPDLLRRLEKGVAAIKMPQDEKEAFFSTLVQSHAQAIKAGVKAGSESAGTVRPPAAASASAAAVTGKPASAPQAVVAAGAIPAGAAVAEKLPDPLTVSPVKARLQALDSHGFDPLAGSLAATATQGQEASSRPGQTTQGPASGSAVGQLKRGSLVEFAGPDGQTILKLAWVSPLKGVYLFTNRNGQNAVSIDKSVLEQKLGSGLARLVDNTGLFDRAMTTMVNQLQASN